MERMNLLYQSKNLRELKVELAGMNVVDIAVFLEELSREDLVIVFRMLQKETAADVFAYLTVDMQQLIVESITDKELSAILEGLYLDDTVDFLEEMPASVVKKVLRNTKEGTRSLINQFLQYPENSAGSIMTIEYVDLKGSYTVEQAFKRIRDTGVDKETIYTCYVTDAGRKLEGLVSVKTLLLSDPLQTVASIMETSILFCKTTDDQEAVAHLFKKYGLLSVPVVDLEQRLVGIITVDDVVEVLEEEATEDFEKMAAMLPSEKPYLKTGIFSLAKNRIFWLMFLMVSGMLTGMVLGNYKNIYAAFPLLVGFIPMLTGTGGNAGSQSATLIIRGIALQEIKMSNILTVLWKEFRVSLLVGLAMCTVTFLRVIIQYPGNYAVALTISLSLIATVAIAKTVGAMLPILSKAIKIDPAIMAAPLISTILDAISLVIYFSIAQLLLPV